MDMGHDIVSTALLFYLHDLEGLVGDDQISSHLLESLVGDLLDSELFLRLSQPKPEFSPCRSPGAHGE
jgi:hypothetical protein